ncbi:hypothetical protein H8A95_21910 [Bradyrhizobium sp. Pear76]|uniref:hypothetical protein n=1 Tax=Bradyrhizobium oropedii TaxID=1571201 RepID=UPI001E4AF5E2|nr:hypothetical protein [Bradyrhizobium oropedii]MCC8964894.1 hypothetical protein [Bradyrhizobium oropedii]
MSLAAADDLLPLEIDPRPCELCGRTIDQHHCQDDGEGPLFFCWDDGDLVTAWELADPRDAWRHTGEAPSPAHVRNSDISGSAGRPPQYRTPQATIDAFRIVLDAGNPDRLATWLRNHPADAPALLEMLEAA